MAITTLANMRLGNLDDDADNFLADGLPDRRRLDRLNARPFVGDHRRVYRIKYDYKTKGGAE